MSEHLSPAGTRRPNSSGSDGGGYPAGRLGCTLNLPSSSSSVPPPSLTVGVQRPLPLLPLSFKDRVCCFRHAKMDNGGYSKICCTHHHPRKHYPSTQWKPPASLWPFPFLPPSRPPSLPLRENPRTSSLSSSRDEDGISSSISSSSPACYRPPITALISASPLPHPPCSPGSDVGFESPSWPRVGQRRRIHLAFPSMLALAPQTSDPTGVIAPTAKCVTYNY